MAIAKRSNGKSAGRDDQLRVLHIISGLGPGGAETVLYRLTTDPSTIHHEVVSLGPRDWYSGLLEESGVPVHHLDCRSTKDALLNAPELRRIVRSSAPDVVQTWMHRGNVFGGLAGRSERRPVVWNIRCSSLETLPLSSRLLARVGGLLARWIPGVIVNCSAKSLEFHKTLGYGAARGVVIPNGYDPQSFKPDEKDRAKMRESLGLRSDEFVLGTLARWHPQKGFPVLFAAMALLLKRDVAVRLVLAGRELDSGNGELKTLIDRHGVGDRLVTLGHRADVDRVARAIDLHVLPSVSSEGFPNAVAETMLSGTPNVVTDIGDAALICGPTGWIVAPSDAEELADAIEAARRQWQDDREGWNRRREKSRARIVEKFSLRRMRSAYENVWRDVVKQSGGEAA